MAAVKFPTLQVNYPDGKTLKLPIDSKGNGDASDADNAPVPRTSLICLSFRANSQV